MVEFAFRIAAVYAALSYALLGLGLTGLCRPSEALGAVLIAALAFLWIAVKAFRRGPLRTHLPTFLLATLLLLIYSHALFIPPFARDDMIYHLQVPKLMAMTGRLAFDPFNANSNFPLLFEMPFAALDVLRTPLSPFVINVGFALLLVLVFHAALAARTSLTAGQRMAASVAFAATPVLFDLLHTGYAEIFFALLILLAALYYLDHLDIGARGAWVKACACLGLACAVKYPGVIFAGVFIASEFFRARDRKRLYRGAALCAASASPWYLKSWILTGNPVFPLANSIFASPYISAMRFQGFHHMLADYNMGRAPLDYLLLPFRLAMGIDEGGPGRGAGFDGRMSLLFAVALAGMGWKDAGRRFITLLAAGYFAVWAVESQQTRFLLAILPIAAVYGLRRAEALPRRSAWIYLGAAVIIAQSAWNIAGKMRSDRILPLLAGTLDRDAFLSAQMPLSYGLSGDINGRLDPKRDKLMTVGTFGRNYYFDIPTLSNTFYEQEVFRNAFERGNAHPDSLSAFLDANGVTYILFAWDYVLKMHAPDKGFDKEALEAYFARTCKTVVEGGHDVLYQRIAPGG